MGDSLTNALAVLPHLSRAKLLKMLQTPGIKDHILCSSRRYGRCQNRRCTDKYILTETHTRFSTPGYQAERLLS